MFNLLNRVKNEQKLEALLTQGLQNKRAGDLAGAKALYLKAIALDPMNVIGYYNLAKVSYLARMCQQAVVNYLRTLHISILNCWINPGACHHESLVNQLDPEFRQFLLSKHEAAVCLPFQTNIITHLGHALIDLDQAVLVQTNEVLCQGQASEHTMAMLMANIKKYRSSLFGSTGKLEVALEENTYNRVGLFYALYNVSWSNLVPNRDVRKIYQDGMQLPHPYNQEPAANDLTSARDADNAARARNLLIKAESGDPEAQFNLGVMYHAGEGVRQDYREAVSWVRRAAEQGYLDAQFNLGLFYYAGEGVRQDYREAVSWFRRAAEQGDPEAQYNLGVMYNEGNGVPQDVRCAMSWFWRAAEQGVASAQYNLGLMYSAGEVVPKDYREAAAWYRRAAEQGHAEAQAVLQELDG